MIDIKELIDSVDLATRQRLFFYELCKIGVVRFDLSNQVHIQTLTQIVDTVTKEFNEEDFSKEPETVQLEIKNRHNLDLLIVQQLLKNTIKSNY